MLVLSISTSTALGSVCLFRDKVVLSSQLLTDQKTHSEKVNLAIQACISEANLKLSDLDGVALDVGPGSFTGIRVAIGIAKSLSLYLKIPIYQVNSLEVIARQQEAPCLVCVNAFKNLVFSAYYDGAKFLSGPRSCSIEAAILEAITLGDHKDLGSLTLVGDGYPSYLHSLSEEHRGLCHWTMGNHNYPLAQTLVTIGTFDQKSSWTQDWHSVLPLYFRGSEAEENLRK